MFGETRFHATRKNGLCFLDMAGEKNVDFTIVLLHGLFGGLSNFDGLLKRMPEYSFFVPEIPFFEFRRADLSIPKLTRWIHDLLNRENVEKPILLGNSLGGHIALEFALKFPERAEALVLTGSSGLFENDLGATKPRRYDRLYIRERAALTFYEDDILDEAVVDEILSVTRSRKKLLRLLTLARSAHSYNMEEKLGSIPHPTLLIWGRNDIITPPEVAEQFRAELPDARLRWIDRCGHAPMMERPDRFAVYLKDFLDLYQNRNLQKFKTETA